MHYLASHAMIELILFFVILYIWTINSGLKHPNAAFRCGKLLDLTFLLGLLLDLVERMEGLTE